MDSEFMGFSFTRSVALLHMQETEPLNRYYKAEPCNKSENLMLPQKNVFEYVVNAVSGVYL